jgi:DNA polymerase III epsilon subunit-like protein
MLDPFTERIIVVDTETTNSLDDPICYDVGFAVVDVFGNVYERYSYVVSEIFLDEELMASAYFVDKIPQYWKEIQEGKRKLAKFSTIRFKFAEVCQKWGVRIVAAHNARFDYRSLNLTQRFLTSSKYRYFFPFGIEVWDTLKMSREVLSKSDEYGEFCYNNDFLTKRLCKRFTAEIIFRFLTGCLDFEEAHTGLEDVMIEKDILAYCFRQHKKMNRLCFG